MSPRPALAAFAALVVLPLAALGTLAACGDTTPTIRQRSAPEWAADLFHPDATARSAAINALHQLGEVHPDVVLSALAERMAMPTPKAGAAPFTVKLDAEGAKRLGLPPVPSGDAYARVLPVLNARLARLDFGRPSVRATSGDDIDVVATTTKSRADVERAQAVICTRAALDLRLVVSDPAGPRPALSMRGKVYDDPMPYAERFAAELRRFEDARREKRVYEPAARRWRLIPRAGTPARGADDFVLVEEPTDASSAMDERLVGEAKAAVEKGENFLVIDVRGDRAADVARFFGGNTGLELAVVLDGEVRARAPMPPSDGKRLVIPLGPTPDGTNAAWAEHLALALPTGRMPLPLTPMPISERFDADPPPQNPFSTVLALLGDKATPTLDKIENGAYPPWAKASAKWAREHAGAADLGGDGR
jgi:hypothetical protein